MELENSIDYHTEWLDAEDYETRILILVSVLADNELAFRGTIPAMTKWLNIRYSTDARNNIKRAIASLEDKRYLYCIVDGNTYTLSISNRGLKDKKVVKLRNEWIETIKNSKGAYWGNLIKVFVICKECNGNIVQMQEISAKAGISSRTFNRCIAILNKLELDNYGCRLYIFTKTKKRYLKEIDKWINVGKQIEVPDFFDEDAYKYLWQDDDKLIPSAESDYIERIYWPDPEEYDYDIEKGVSY